MRIQPVEKEEASEAVQSVYREIERRAGRVSTLYKMLGHKPEVLHTFAAFYQAIWAPGTLSPKLRELAYLRTSILNGCAY
jgi:alkylhydroperoxidase family enzyme